MMIRHDDKYLLTLFFDHIKLVTRSQNDEVTDKETNLTKTSSKSNRSKSSLKVPLALTDYLPPVACFSSFELPSLNRCRIIHSHIKWFAEINACIWLG